MHVKLRLLGGSHAGQEIAVPAPTFRIGRAADCQLRPRSDAVAERHCEVRVEPGQVTIADLGSPGGTFLNGKRLDGAEVLKAGDRLRVGPLEFEVSITVPVAGTKKPMVKSVEEAAARMASGARDDIDIDSLLSGGDDVGVAPSRYATNLSADEVASLSKGAPPEAVKPGTAEPAKDGTSDKAADALNKMYKRR